MKKIRIARIISTKQVVINAGKLDGIQEGEEFDIIDNISDSDIKDPETGESLGKLSTTKGRVIVSKVFDRMSIADAPYQRIDSTALAAFNYQKDLNVDPKQIEGGLPDSSSTPIQVGDVLEEVKG